MFQPPQVAVIEFAQIRYIILKHSQPFYTGAKSKAAVFVWVYAAVFEYVWVDHAGSQDFYPILTLTYNNLVFGTAITFNIYLC